MVISFTVTAISGIYPYHSKVRHFPPGWQPLPAMRRFLGSISHSKGESHAPSPILRSPAERRGDCRGGSRCAADRHPTDARGGALRQARCAAALVRLGALPVASDPCL